MANKFRSAKIEVTDNGYTVYFDQPQRDMLYDKKYFKVAKTLDEVKDLLAADLIVLLD